MYLPMAPVAIMLNLRADALTAAQSSLLPVFFGPSPPVAFRRVYGT